MRLSDACPGLAISKDACQAPRRRRQPLSIALLLAGAIPAASAHAQSLTIESIEHGAWSDTVAALQAAPSWQGRAIHVRVRDELGRAVACGSYALSLDDAGAAAFRVRDCDAATSATELELVSRHELFDHGGLVARP